MATDYRTDPVAREAYEQWKSGQSGYIGKTKKAEWWNNYAQSQQNQSNLNNIFSGDPAQFSMSGSAKEQQGRIEGLQRAKILTGQNPYEIGKDYQAGMGMLRDRANQTDTASEMIRASKAGAVADARNQLQQQGVKGGAALGAVSAIERQKAYDVNNQLYENQRQSQNDFMNAVKSNANFTNANEMNYGSLAAGGDIKVAPQNSNGFGTVICTELYIRGIMDYKTYQGEVALGKHLRAHAPEVYFGYRFWADPVVSLMVKSHLFSIFVSWFVLPWTKRENNLFGKLIHFFGYPTCKLTGKLIGGKYENYKKI